MHDEKCFHSLKNDQVFSTIHITYRNYCKQTGGVLFCFQIARAYIKHYINIYKYVYYITFFLLRVAQHKQLKKQNKTKNLE